MILFLIEAMHIWGSVQNAVFITHWFVIPINYYCSEHIYDDVIKWEAFLPRYWPFVRGIHWSPVNSPHKGQWRGALMFSLICAWIHGRVNNGEAGDLRSHGAYYDVTVMYTDLIRPRLAVTVIVWRSHISEFTRTLSVLVRMPQNINGIYPDQRDILAKL